MPTRRARIRRRALLEAPFELLVAFLCLLAAGPLVAGRDADAILPLWLAIVWGVELGLGGAALVVAIMGGYVRLERRGLELLGAASVVYSFVAVTKGDVFEALPTILFALACAGRWVATKRTAVLHLPPGKVI